MMQTCGMQNPLNITKICNHKNNSLHLIPNCFLPGFKLNHFGASKLINKNHENRVWASLLENPVIWATRVCVFYALLKAGFAGSPSNPLLSNHGSCLLLLLLLLLLVYFVTNYSDLGSAGFSYVSDLGFSVWLDKFRRSPDKEAADKRKLLSKWHPTTKGTLRRNYRIPSKPEGRRLLKAIAALLSEDDHVVDASSHKGCQIRRESAHGESVCCNNVRALFDELPTPHLIVEISPFPAGPLTDNDYAKAEKLERVLRSSPSV